MSRSEPFTDVGSPVIVFRTDASLDIGSGHVMRCLTLAATLCEQGAQCHFICREHVGHLCSYIESKGFRVHRLPVVERKNEAAASQPPGALAHAHWLGAGWKQDAETCGALLAGLAPAWLVVDHYALDGEWETAVLNEFSDRKPRLLAIDDLADRHHVADLLLDQNLGRDAKDYQDLVPEKCRIFIGPRFALLRSEFVRWREVSLARRAQSPWLKRVLISMGGVDKDNATGRVLDALKSCDMPKDIEITVVMGSAAPWLDRITTQASLMPWSTEVVLNIDDMARRMAESDLAIGAAGSTSWERCCLGLPTIMLVLADNQRPTAEALHNVGAALCLGTVRELHNLAGGVSGLQFPAALQSMSRAAAQVTAGEGVTALSHEMVI